MVVHNYSTPGIDSKQLAIDLLKFGKGFVLQIGRDLA